MPDPTFDDRISVTASATTLGVSMHLGDTVVALTLPAPKGLGDVQPDAARAVALRLASRALDVAQEELRQAQGAARNPDRGA